MRRLTPEKRRALDALLKAAFDAVAAEPIPQSIHDKLKGLP